jgi:8-amino-7-oxononanoate synthase
MLSGNQVEIESDGTRYLNFSSNDYLGLANDSELVGHWQTGLSLYGAGSGASPLVTGFCSAHQNLESQLCEWLGYQRAILFNSGFSANQAALFTLLGKDDHLIQDKLNHASLIEAGRLSPAVMKRFKHNDTQHLKALLSLHAETLVVTEGVFSMDGDQAPLSELNDIVKAHPLCSLMVDDAHGIGVLGDGGRGSCSVADVQPDILVVTFGKAFGMSGAAILCDANLGDYLTQFARHHVYSTAMPPAQAYALSHAVTMIQTQQWRRDKLGDLQAEYRHQVANLTPFVASGTPINPFILGEASRVTHAALVLRQSGVWVSAIRPPTVPNGSGRLRITLTANHTKQHVVTLGRSLNRLVEMMSSWD